MPQENFANKETKQEQNFTNPQNKCKIKKNLQIQNTQTPKQLQERNMANSLYNRSAQCH